MQSPVVPRFFLYGEPPRVVSDRFLHLEDLGDRSLPSDRELRLHAHAKLNHFFFIIAGTGAMQAEAHAFEFAAPCLLIVPARVVHAFRYDPGTRGSILTIADPYLRAFLLREPDLESSFAVATCVVLADGTPFEADLRGLAKELVWQAPGHEAALEGRLLAILVDASRAVQQARIEASPMIGPHALLVARFRTLVEERFRDNLGLEAYATALAVSVARLRNACLKHAKTTPTQMVQERIMLEARRLLLYSNMTVAEVGFTLGFKDPAYFSRFFAKAAAESPRGFRQRHQESVTDAAAGHRASNGPERDDRAR